MHSYARQVSARVAALAAASVATLACSGRVSRGAELLSPSLADGGARPDAGGLPDGAAALADGSSGAAPPGLSEEGGEQSSGVVTTNGGSGGPVTPEPGQNTNDSANTLIQAEGYDWSLPAGAMVAQNSGFFSEADSAQHHVHLSSVDVTWRQLNPQAGSYGGSATGSAQGMTFRSLDAQLATTSPFWMRVWVSGTTWAPSWVAAECGVSSVGPDYDNQRHLPVWDPCVWDHVKAMYRYLMVERNLRADPRLRFIYVPGAFTWCEFDYEMVSAAARSGALSLPQFRSWFATMTADLVNIMNGENDRTDDDFAYKLVFTGEDYPWGPWGASDDLFARDAVHAGMGIRTGITEVFNNHLSNLPAYGTTVDARGYMVTDESAPALDGKRVVATENECFDDCGFSTRSEDERAYAVMMSNLKALQMRVNWLYVVPSASFMSAYADHYAWVEKSLGHTAATSRDAWAFLRDAEDRYWAGDDSRTWSGKPYVKNFERFLWQRDVSPDGESARGNERRTGVLVEENGSSYEGRRTQHANGQHALYFFLHDAFVSPSRVQPLDVKVTYLDAGTGDFWLEYLDALGAMRESPKASRGGSGRLRTATFHIENLLPGNGLTDNADFRVFAAESGADLDVRMVRVVKP